MTKKRVIIIIDGSNFYFKLKELKLHDLLNLDFSGFVKKLSKNYKVVDVCYYVGKVKTGNSEKSKELHANQQRLFAHLRLHKIRYSLGYLLKSGGRYHEKGVDVNMAVDIMRAIYKDLCDHIILISSDTDMLPVINEAKENGKSVEYIGFSHQPSLAMIANCSEPTLLKVDDIQPFIKK